jgi:transcriptional regulator with XRE-family HTH domain
LADPRIGRSRLPELLAKTGKTQVDLADHLDVSESFISQVVKGKTKLSVAKMKKTADYLNCNMDDLYEWDYSPGKR